MNNSNEFPDEAAKQAVKYYNSIDNVDKSKLIITNDFYNLNVYSEEKNNPKITSFSLNELPINIHLFYDLLKYEHEKIVPEVVEKQMVKNIEKEVIVRRPGYWILIWAREPLRKGDGYGKMEGRCKGRPWP